MNRLFFIILLGLFLMLSISSSSVFAAKKFVKKQATTSKSVSGGVPVAVRYRPDKQGLLFSFSSFRGIDSVSYSFIYSTNGVSQGAGGTISSSNSPASERELLFGTCSTSVCTYHHNLVNARLVFTAKLTNGKTVTKSYRIKTYQ